EELERVAGHVRQLVDRVARAGLGRAPAVVAHLDAALLEPVGEGLRLLVGQLLGELGELGQVDASLLLAAVDEGLKCDGAHGCRLPDSAIAEPAYPGFTDTDMVAPWRSS